MRVIHLFSVLFVGLASLGALSFRSIPTAPSAPLADVTENEASVDFPNSVTFQSTIRSNARITSVVLEYGTRQLTCGQVIARAFPQFTSGTTVRPEWTWDMRQSGSLPPGASIWWRWRYTDETGHETVSSEKTITWLDSEHTWRQVSGGMLRVHWYTGDQSFAQDLLDTALAGLVRLKRDTGLVPDEPIDLYIYANVYALRDAVLFEPGWTGGLAFPEHNVVIIGISPSDLDWGRKAEVHELTHVLVGHLTFSCLGGLPTWLEEGLAVYSEGALDAASRAQLEEAIRDNTLLSVRSLSTGFSEVPDKAYLSYSESYSIVKFLIETYGQEKMTALLLAQRDGMTIDEALMQVYGFDVDGLEDEWRAAIGAPPRPVSASATAQPTPSLVPTIVPISGAPLAITPTPLSIPTSSTNGGSDTSGAPPLGLTLALLGFCCLIVLVVGVFVIGLVVTSQKRNVEQR